jgi:hypothetical protein
MHLRWYGALLLQYTHNELYPVEFAGATRAASKRPTKTHRKDVLIQAGPINLSCQVLPKVQCADTRLGLRRAARLYQCRAGRQGDCYGCLAVIDALVEASDRLAREADEKFPEEGEDHPHPPR